MARGKSRSAKPSDILSKINSLIDNGAKEIILSGINIGDYGILNEKMLKIIEDEIDNLRLRISSIEPN